MATSSSRTSRFRFAKSPSSFDCLPRHPDRRLERDDVVAGSGKRSEEIVDADVLSVAHRVRAVLLPHCVQRAAWPPFPSKHDIAAKGQVVEITIGQVEGGR